MTLSSLPPDHRPLAAGLEVSSPRSRAFPTLPSPQFLTMSMQFCTPQEPTGSRSPPALGVGVALAIGRWNPRAPTPPARNSTPIPFLGAACLPETAASLPLAHKRERLRSKLVGSLYPTNKLAWIGDAFAALKLSGCRFLPVPCGSLQFLSSPVPLFQSRSPGHESHLRRCSSMAAASYPSPSA